MSTIFIYPEDFHKLRTAIIFKINRDVDKILNELGVHNVLKIKLTHDKIICYTINGEVHIKMRDIFD